MPRPGRMTTERAKDFKGTLLQLVRNLGRYRLSLVTAIVFAILSTIFNIAGPKVLAKATTALATGWIAKLRGTGSIDFVYIGRILLFLLGMYLLSSAFSFIQGWLMTGLSQKVCYDFRKQISEKINRLPLAYFEKRTVGEVLSRITNDVDTLGQSLNQSITQLITSVTTMIGVLVMMLSISPKMTLIALLILPVSLVLVLIVVRFSQKYFKAQQAILGVVNGQVEEVYSGHNVVKAFNREAVVLNDFNAANDKLYESAWKSQFLSGLMMPIMNFVGNLGYVAVAIVGSIFAANGTITIGDIQAFIQYVKNFTQPIQQLSQVSNMLQSMAAAAERVFEFLNEPEEDQQADPARRADPGCINGQVTFSHVRFGYTPDKTVIHDFSCEVKPGQKVAIVSSKPQTTRTRITGLLNKNGTQYVFLDTPGLHKPRTQLGDYMCKVVTDTVSEVDAAMLVVEPIANIGPAEESLIAQIKAHHMPAVLVINKIDTVKKEELLNVIATYAAAHEFEAVVPISARTGEGLDDLLGELSKYAIEGPQLFPEDMVSDQPERQLVAEIIREKMLRLLDREVPHGVAVGIERWHEREDGLVEINAVIYCEKASHKVIIIGKQGAMLREIGKQARGDIERMLDAKVYLELWVKVKEGWRNNQYQMRNFGYEEQ